MGSAKWRPWCAMLGLITSPVMAQHIPTAHEGGGGAVWHDAQRYRELLSGAPLVATMLAQAMEAELALGRPAGALELLAAYGGDTLGSHVEIQPVRAAAEFALGRPAMAARLFDAAAASAPDPVNAAAYLTRAADAFFEAGLPVAARERYRRASEHLVLVRGWIAIREARAVADPSEALALLAQVPPGAEPFAALARAEQLLVAGDTARATAELVVAKRAGAAAAMALAHGDTTRARSIAYDALTDRDTLVVRGALDIVTRTLRPEGAAQLLQVGRAQQRLGQTRVAMRLVADAVQAGDSTAATLRLLGDLESANGRSSDALATYARAAAVGGIEGALASYRRARLLIRAGRRTEGQAALLEFAAQHPDHPEAPLAVYLVADDERAAGRTTRADSLYREVARRWPAADYAARARFHLASMALRAGDTVGALGWYEDEVAARGAQQLAARYEIARVRHATGDTAGARVAWEALARRDPIGYYGTISRHAAALPLPSYPASAIPAGGLSVQRTLATLDLLQRFGWSAEAEAIVADALERRTWPPEDALALGDGLIQRGWMAQGVTLGWRAASALGTSDPRVLRVIFPWPFRAIIEAEAKKYGLDPYLVAGLIRQESTFRPAVISRAGATGLMQLMPTTASWLAQRLGVDWNERLLAIADANLHLGAAHLAGLLDRYEGSEVFALAAYNAGGRPVDRWRRFPEADDPFQFVERIPYVETRGYVRAVLRNRDLYRALYPEGSQAPDAASQ